MMQAYMNDVTVRDGFVARMKAHAAADELVRGQGWEDGKGCAIGCMFNAYDHSQFPAQLGLPEWLGRLVDAIFEGLPEERAMRWPVEFLEAVPVGSLIGDDIMDELGALRLESLLPALVANQEGYARECEAALKGCIAFLRDVVKTESAALSAAWGAKSAAWSAAKSATWSAESATWSAESAAESAESAARSAESAAESAARRAERSAESAARSAESAAWGAESAAWEWEADTLLALLRAAK